MKIIKNDKIINNIFTTGSTKRSGIITMKSIDSTEPEFVFAVSSKIFKRAVDRNLLKRRMKEAVRNNIDKFKNKSIAIIYSAHDIRDYSEIETSIKGL
jgi:ribonuclease P protein component